MGMCPGEKRCPYIEAALAEAQAKLAAADSIQDRQNKDWSKQRARIAALEAEIARLHEELAYYCNHPEHKRLAARTRGGKTA